MTPERFNEIVGEIKDRFGVESEFEEEIEDIPEGKLSGIIFVTPVGKMKLEFSRTPSVVDSKTIYSKLQGSAGDTEYTYDLDDIKYSMKAYKDENGEWIEVEKTGLF
ncbi:MAG: hypothetical protein ACD_76C00120G0004 [uncultured bacterium]|nr:MAG: hypothetical protein ACD_76C00120G0004 [uncultured bacterium]HBD04860.1 hypothetical protein [Candidatus Uhrbacteria bacterium]